MQGYGRDNRIAVLCDTPDRVAGPARPAFIRWLMPARSGPSPAVPAYVAASKSLEPHHPTLDVVDAEIVGEVPDRKELIRIGRADRLDLDYNPDDYVDPEVDEELRSGRAENTWDTVDHRWGLWIWWCGARGRDHRPGYMRVNSVRQYIKEHWDMDKPDGKGGRVKRGRYGQPYSPRTVELDVYVISMVCQWAGYVSPVKHPSVGVQLKAYHRKYERAGFRADSAYALSYEDNVAVARTCDQTTLAGLRNACAFRLQFDTGCRASELLHLRRKDVRWESDDRIVLYVSRSKTDQAAEGREIGVERVAGVDDDVDPVQLLTRWWEVTAGAGHTDPNGALFVEVNAAVPRKDGSMAGSLREVPWEYPGYETALGRAVKKAGLQVDPKTGERRHITSHSNRAGMITEAVDAGVPLEKVGTRTGHSLSSKSLHGYYRTRRRWGTANAGTVIRTARRRPVGGKK